MALLSLNFLIFLILVTAVYFLVPGRFRWGVLLIGSYAFYLIGAGLRPFLFVLFTTLTTFFAGRAMGRLQTAGTEQWKNAPPEEKKALKEKTAAGKRKILTAALAADLGVLILLKYARFLLEILDRAAASFGIGGTGPFFSGILLPLGISFYTLQAAGYLIDVYRGKYPPEQNLFHFSLFISFFPQVIQGPIGRYNLLSEQLITPHEWDDCRFRAGFMRLLWGYFKKLVIAERAAVIANEIFRGFDGDYKGFVILCGTLIYGIQIYADFSGGMDIVFGASEILGIRLTENFRQPHFAKSVTEFWQRWHITLGSWVRDYVFYPFSLSGTASALQKKARKRFGPYYGRILIPTIASFLSFLLVGIWHGADLKYAVYGFYMAFFVSTNTLCERLYGKMRAFFHVNPENWSWKLFQILRTWFIVSLGRIFSHGDSLRSALAMIRAMFSSWNFRIFFDGTMQDLGLNEANMNLLLFSVLLLFAVDYVNEKGIRIREKIAEQNFVIRWGVYYAAVILILVLGRYGSGYDAASFIYQQF